MRKPGFVRAAAALALAAVASSQQPAARPPESPAPAAAAATLFTERAARYAAFSNDKVVEAVRRGVVWLVAHQDEDGKFDPADFGKHDGGDVARGGAGNRQRVVGVTGLALLALLAQGDAQHVDACRSAADWLSDNVKANATVGPAFHDEIYDHAIGTFALVEAAAAFGKERHRDAAERNILALRQWRNPGAAWRYLPRDGQNDVSVTVWCLAAMCEAVRIGIECPSFEVGQAMAYLDSVANARTGHHGYTKVDEPSSRMPGRHHAMFPSDLGHAMTAAGMHARLVVGADPDSDMARGASALLAERLPSTQPGAYDLYYWFHGSCVMALMPAGQATRKWDAALHKTLLGMQRKEKGVAGSWDPTDVWGEAGGRVASTALAVLALASPYRLERRDLKSLLPDAEPFKKPRAFVVEGRVGAALAEVGKIDVAQIAPEVAATLRQFRWQVEVLATQAQFCLAMIDSPDMPIDGKVAMCEEQAARFEGLPVGDAYAKTLRRLRDDPLVRRELQAFKALRPLADDVEPARRAKSSAVRVRLRERLAKFCEQHPGTQAAARATTYLARLSGD